MLFQKKLQKANERIKELEEILGSPDVFQDQKAYKKYTQEHSNLSEMKHAADELDSSRKHLEETVALLKEEGETEFAAMLREEIDKLQALIPKLEIKLKALLLPPDPTDHLNTIIELRAGTGGDEAALFVADCARMYKLFADKMGWGYEELSVSPSELGGFKEYVMVLSGKNVFRTMKFEGGTHRVQRVPATEAQGRVHTSAITIAVLPEPNEEVTVKIDERDLRIDTYRSSGAGGQHVNTTDSAVRVTHIPTGVVVYCQEERSQHKNKEKALRLLRARILEQEERKKWEAIAKARSEQVGTGDRSERIRTYNFPQNRVTDHRINLTKHNLHLVMEGDLEEITSALVAHYSQEDE